MSYSFQSSKNDDVISMSLTILIVMLVIGLMYMIYRNSYSEGMEDGKNSVYIEARELGYGEFKESGTFNWNKKDENPRGIHRKN